MNVLRIVVSSLSEDWADVFGCPSQEYSSSTDVVDNNSHDDKHIIMRMVIRAIVVGKLL